LKSGGANADMVVSGSITVADTSYWDKIKLGVFSGGEEGTYGYCLEAWDKNYGIEFYRLVYSCAAWECPVAINPRDNISYSIIGDGETERHYSFEVPEKPIVNEKLYFAAWYDSNNNGVLDLCDANLIEEIGAGEFNRCAVKKIINDNGIAQTIAIGGFADELVGYKNGHSLENTYKYYGCFYAANESEGVELGADDNPGFNFVISANSGW
jgi:hypothetical protein